MTEYVHLQLATLNTEHRVLFIESKRFFVVSHFPRVGAEDVHDFQWLVVRVE